MKVLRLIIIFCAFYMLMIPVNMIRFGYDVNNAFWRTTLFLFEGTVWAPGFSESKFNQIKIGDNEQRVLSILGKPIVRETDCGNSCFWRYTHQDTATADHDQRAFVFDKQGVVIEIRKDFFID